MSTTKCVECQRTFEKFFDDENKCIICHQHEMVCIGKDCKSCKKIKTKKEKTQ